MPTFPEDPDDKPAYLKEQPTQPKTVHCTNFVLLTDESDKLWTPRLKRVSDQMLEMKRSR